MKPLSATLFSVIFCSSPMMAHDLNTLVDGGVSQGESLYLSKCGACHSIDANRVGPKHKGVFGRKAGSVEDYSYSRALSNSKVIWNESNLDAWLSNPQKFIPGQRMGFRLTKPDERKSIIAYLKGVK